MIPFNLDPIQGWIFILCLVLLSVQLFYYLGVFGKLAFYKQPVRADVQEPVSVIICARNELKNLKANLPAVLNQKYPRFQVIVVNDCSWDESGSYLEEIQPSYPHLKIVTINEQEKYRHGKKFALSLGIKAAAHEIVLLTDADCAPVSPDWISTMVRGYQSGTELVIGYGAYRKGPGLLNKWVRMDTVFNAVQYLSRAIGGNAYMGVGRNLSYKKALFFRVKGFASHNHIMSGDDDLFVNQTSSSSNTSVVLDPAAFTVSEPRTTFSGWLLQKKRHMSTGFRYRAGDKMWISIFFSSHFLFYSALAIMWIEGIPVNLIAGVYLLRMLVQMIIFGRCMKKLNEFDLIWLVPFFDLLIVILYPALSVSNMIIKEKKWR